MSDRRAEQAAQTAALRALAQDLARDIADLADKIAQTEDNLARVHEDIARDGVSAVAEHALEHAARARRFAEHERSEQQRWSAAAELLHPQPLTSHRRKPPDDPDRDQ